LSQKATLDFNNAKVDEAIHTCDPAKQMTDPKGTLITTASAKTAWARSFTRAQAFYYFDQRMQEADEAAGTAGSK